MISPELTGSRRRIRPEVNIPGNGIDPCSPTQIRAGRMTHSGILRVWIAGRAGREHATGILDDLEPGRADVVEAISPDLQGQ